MTEISRPLLNETHPDRLLHCEEMLEKAFIDPADRGAARGWRLDEVALALQSLADSYMFERQENANTDDAISHARKCVQH